MNKYISKNPLTVTAVLYDGSDESIEQIKEMFPLYKDSIYRINTHEQFNKSTGKWELIDSDLNIKKKDLVVRQGFYVARLDAISPIGLKDVVVIPKHMFEKDFYIM